ERMSLGDARGLEGGGDVAVELGAGNEPVVVDVGDPPGGVLAPDLEHGMDAANLADEETGLVDVVRAEIAGGAAAGTPGAVAPGEAAVRMLHVDEEIAAEMSDTADLAVGDHAPRQLQRRDEAVDVGAHVL